MEEGRDPGDVGGEEDTGRAVEAITRRGLSVTAWLGVASAEHVRRGVELGIAQIGHGKRSGLARMKAGDTLVYYSPVEKLDDGTPLRHFTTLGTIADDEIWQADEGDFRPFRRKVTYEDVRPVPLQEVKDRLKLTASPNWGYQLRRGLIPLDEEDLAVLRTAFLGQEKGGAGGIGG